MDNKEYLKKWRDNNPDAYKQWVEDNYDRRLEINREWYARNREAQVDRVRGYYQENKEELKRNSWARSLWSRYKMTVEDYMVLLEQQDGLCFICQKPPMKQRLAVDHDHKCCPKTPTCGGCVRGLLHMKCNTSLGWFETNSDRIIKYLLGTGHEEEG